ncbi:MAG: aspartate aminotransferase family protein [Lautropia sp.]|nr:aspartate aminotransferase family protein [Lautropia sp.]
MTKPSPLMSTYLRQAVAFERGEGSILFDTRGRRYLDCLSGIAVNTLGHAHPALVAALSDQVGKLIHCSNLFEIPLQEEVARRLVRLSGMSNVFFCNSGLEANEAALKLARLHGHQKGITEPHVVVFDKAFHGRSIATLSATGNPKVQKGFEPLVPGFPRLPLNDIGALKALAGQDPNISAVFLEAIQGEGGITAASIEFLQQLRQLCDERGWLLMIDEVQCGMGRTGRWFAHQWAGITPDVMPLAKGLGSGVPVGAVVAHGAAAELFRPGHHGTTFGGNPLAMRAAQTTIDVMEADGLVENATRIGNLLRDTFQRELQDTPGFVELRGKGLMLGIALDRPCGELVGRALEAGLVLNVTADSVIRLLPPLVFTDENAAELTDRLLPLIRDFLASPAA